MTSLRVVAVVPDLFFATRISATAGQVGVELELPPPATALDTIRSAPPALVVLDLHAPGDPLALVRALRADPATRSLRVIGFYSHVDRALREAALAAGVDEAIPRSAFTRRLPAILHGERGDPASPPQV
jgi:CheY-like chemotaxis protein